MAVQLQKMRLIVAGNETGAVRLLALVSLPSDLSRLYQRFPQAVPAQNMQAACVATFGADGVVDDVLEPLARHPLAFSRV